MLLFKKKFLADIRAGRKTQTIRVWKFRHMRAGQRSYIPGVGYIQVDEVEAVSLEDLTDEDAIPDGFATAEGLRAEIRRIYSEEQLRERKVFRIRFHVLPAEEQKRAREERRQRRAAQSKG
ncbi:MAG: ASCH domain-containing protein [Thermogutta sp.]|jgi:hypothetical protein